MACILHAFYSLISTQRNFPDMRIAAYDNTKRYIIIKFKFTYLLIAMWFLPALS